MPVWIIVGVCAAIFVAAIAVAGAMNLFESPMGDEETKPTPARAQLPADFTAADLRSLEFSPALRGYNMEQVDRVIGTLLKRLEKLEGTSAAPGAAGSRESEFGAALRGEPDPQDVRTDPTA